MIEIPRILKSLGRMDSSLVSTKQKIDALAFEHRDCARGFGGWGPTMGDLMRLCDADYGTVFDSLKQLHLEGRIYLQYWHWGPDGFRPWTPDLDKSFFDIGFRLLNEKPV